MPALLIGLKFLGVPEPSPLALGLFAAVACGVLSRWRK